MHRRDFFGATVSCVIAAVAVVGCKSNKKDGKTPPSYYTTDAGISSSGTNKKRLEFVDVKWSDKEHRFKEIEVSNMRKARNNERT